MLLPSILAAEAGGQGRFELEAETVGDALRALPVANMLFDERGELRRLVNVYVDGVDIRGGDGVDSPLAGGEDAPRRSGGRGRLSHQRGQRGSRLARSGDVALPFVTDDRLFERKTGLLDPTCYAEHLAEIRERLRLRVEVVGRLRQLHCLAGKPLGRRGVAPSCGQLRSRAMETDLAIRVLVHNLARAELDPRLGLLDPALVVQRVCQ